MAVCMCFEWLTRHFAPRVAAMNEIVKKAEEGKKKSFLPATLQRPPASFETYRNVAKQTNADLITATMQRKGKEKVLH